MSVDRWLFVMTDAELASANDKAGWGESWFHTIPRHAPMFEFGDARDDLNADRAGCLAWESLSGLEITPKTIEQALCFYRHCSDWSEKKEQTIRQVIEKYINSNYKFQTWAG